MPWWFCNRVADLLMWMILSFLRLSQCRTTVLFLPISQKSSDLSSRVSSPALLLQPQFPATAAPREKNGQPHCVGSWHEWKSLCPSLPTSPLHWLGEQRVSARRGLLPGQFTFQPCGLATHFLLQWVPGALPCPTRSTLKVPDTGWTAEDKRASGRPLPKQHHLLLFPATQRTFLRLRTGSGSESGLQPAAPDPSE